MVHTSAQPHSVESEDPPHALRGREQMRNHMHQKRDFQVSSAIIQQSYLSQLNDNFILGMEPANSNCTTRRSKQGRPYKLTDRYKGQICNSLLNASDDLITSSLQKCTRTCSDPVRKSLQKEADRISFVIH